MSCCPVLVRIKSPSVSVSRCNTALSNGLLITKKTRCLRTPRAPARDCVPCTPISECISGSTLDLECAQRCTSLRCSHKGFLGGELHCSFNVVRLAPVAVRAAIRVMRASGRCGCAALRDRRRPYRLPLQRWDAGRRGAQEICRRR